MNGMITAALAAAICAGVAAATLLGAKNAENIDQVTANPAFNKVRPITDLTPDGFNSQETARLDYLETLLRSRDVSDWPEELQEERARNIQRLHDYRIAGRFPINYDHPDLPLPCFLDRDGNLCAVANLIAKSAGMDLVRKINDRYQYSTVSDMHMAEIDDWVGGSGLTPEEVVTIQAPSFGGPEISTDKIARIDLKIDTAGVTTIDIAGAVVTSSPYFVRGSRLSIAEPLQADTIVALSPDPQTTARPVADKAAPKIR